MCLYYQGGLSTDMIYLYAFRPLIGFQGSSCGVCFSHFFKAQPICSPLTPVVLELMLSW